MDNLLKKTGENSDLSRCSKIRFDDFFKRAFDASFDIFVSTSRTILNFFTTHSLMFGKRFRYLQCALKVIFTILEPFKIIISSEMEETLFFRDNPKSVLTIFLMFPLIFSFLRVVRP